VKHKSYEDKALPKELRKSSTTGSVKTLWTELGLIRKTHKRNLDVSFLVCHF